MQRKMRTTILKWILLTGLLCYAVTMTVWASSRASQRVCPGVEVEVTGVRPEMEASVRAGVMRHLNNFCNPVGQSIGSLNLPAIQKWMSEEGNLERATCAFLPDGRLLVRVEALVPEMRVFGPGGESYYVNRDGKRMPARQEYFTDVPIVSGRFDKKFPETKLLLLVQALSGDRMLSQVISMIDVKSPSDIYLVPRMQGHRVNLGDISDMDKKLTALKAFYRKVMPYRGWQKYEMLSLKYKGRVIATLRDKPVVETVGADTVPDAEEQALRQSEIDPIPNPAPLTNR